jgi:hypothetical protein
MATELTMLGPVQTSNPVNTVQTVYGPTLGGKKCFFPSFLKQSFVVHMMGFNDDSVN